MTTRIYGYALLSALLLVGVLVLLTSAGHPPYTIDLTVHGIPSVCQLVTSHGQIFANNCVATS